MTTHLQQTMDDLLAQRARLDAAIAALQDLGAAAEASPNGNVRAARRGRRTRAATPAPRVSTNGKVRCDRGGGLFKRQGLGPHQRGCKGAEKKTVAAKAPAA